RSGGPRRVQLSAALERRELERHGWRDRCRRLLEEAILRWLVLDYSPEAGHKLDQLAFKTIQEIPRETRRLRARHQDPCRDVREYREDRREKTRRRSRSARAVGRCGTRRGDGTGRGHGSRGNLPRLSTYSCAGGAAFRTAL